MNDQIAKILYSFEPSAIGRYLIRAGYSLHGEEKGLAQIYIDESGNSIILPIKKSFRDYISRIKDVIDLLAIDDLTFDDVVGLIASPDSDIFKYRIETPESAWGQLRLWYSYHAMHALFDVFQFTAAGISSQLRNYTNVSGPAKDYANACRFGQTEYGSFIIKVFCPTNPLNTMEDIGEPFGRASTRSVMENLEFVSSIQSEDPSVPLPPTLNSQVASAIERLKPDSDFASTTAKIRYSPIPLKSTGLMIVHSSEETQSIHIDPFIYSRARSLKDRLTKAEEYGREIMQGYITDLHKDRPTTIEPSRQISLEVKFGTSYRKVTMRLLPSDYKNAVNWHDQDELLVIDAVFDKRGRPWTVVELTSLKPVDKSHSSATLFD